MTEGQIQESAWAGLVTDILRDLRQQIQDVRETVAELDHATAKRRQLDSIESRVDAIERMRR